MERILGLNTRVSSTANGKRRPMPQLVAIYGDEDEKATNMTRRKQNRGMGSSAARHQQYALSNVQDASAYTQKELNRYQSRHLERNGASQRSPKRGSRNTSPNKRKHAREHRQLPPLQSATDAVNMPSVSISKDSKYTNPLTSTKAPKLKSHSLHRRIVGEGNRSQYAMHQHQHTHPESYTPSGSLPGISSASWVDPYNRPKLPFDLVRPSTRSQHIPGYHHRHSNRITNEIYKRSLGASSSAAHRAPNGQHNPFVQPQKSRHPSPQKSPLDSSIHSRARQPNHILCQFPIVTLLLQFLTGIQEWSNDLIFHKELASYLSISSHWYRSICTYMIELRMKRMNRLMEKIGIEFCRIPEGVYMVGSNFPESKAFYNVPSQFVKIDEFYMSKRVLRHSDWEMIANLLREEIVAGDANSSFSSWGESQNLNHLVSPELIQQSQLNTIFLPDCHVHIPRDTDDSQPDPLLILPFKNCAQIANALGASLPTWQQWEVAARGKDSLPFPWGSQPIQSRSVGVEHVEYAYTTFDSNFRQRQKTGRVTRIKSLRQYQRCKSPFGVEDLVLFGKEFNVAQNDLTVRSLPAVSSHRMFQECHVDTHLLRSLCYLGPQTIFMPPSNATDQNPINMQGFERMASSEHRSFNGPSLSACEPHVGCTPITNAPHGDPDIEAAAPTVGGGRYHQQKGAFRLIFSMSSWFQVHPLFSTGLHQCLRCHTRQRHHPLCMSCLRGDGTTHPLWFTLLGELWQNVPQIVGIDADMEKKIPDWTRHRFHFLYYEGILLSSTLAKNEPRTVDDLMRVEEITFCGPQYTVEINGYTFEHGYLRDAISGLRFGMGYEEIRRVFGEGDMIQDGILEYGMHDNPIIRDRIVILYFDTKGQLERISVRLRRFKREDVAIAAGAERAEDFMYEDFAGDDEAESPDFDPAVMA